MDKNVTTRDLHDLEKRVYDLERAQHRTLDDMRVFRNLITDLLARIRGLGTIDNEMRDRGARLRIYGTTSREAIGQATYDDPHYIREVRP